MMLSDILRHPVKYPGPGQHAEHGHHLAEVTRLADARRAKRHRQQFYDQ